MTYSMYWSKLARSLSPYIPGEQPRQGTFIKLNTNENPYPPSPLVIEAIQKAAGDHLRLYPDPACTELRQAIAHRYGVQPKQVFAGNGSDEVLAFAFGAFFNAPGPGDAAPLNGSGSSPQGIPICFPDITYSFYPVYAGLWGIPYRTIPVAEDFSIDYQAFKIASGGVVIPNPNAPTGRALPIAELLSIVQGDNEGAPDRVVLVDEAYTAFGAETAVPYIAAYPNLLTVHTLSKAASLAGLRVGFAIGAEALIEGLCRIRDSFNSYTLDRLAQAGAQAAIMDSPYYDAVNRMVIATRERVAAALISMGVEVIPSSANFLFIRSPEKKGTGFFAALRDRGILVRHFDKPRIADYLRVSMGTDAEMDVFLEQCRNILMKS
ncbi:MAG: aminotransferase class I/II-fold pyridoxal phosphate-dependent enzyme [Treponema sp.]|nr:aminotransferase class I/II-fold pyridoxal phosphate-dependent enzyme [Treponema sp.]